MNGPLTRVALVSCVLAGLVGPACARGLPPTTPVSRKADWWKARHLRIKTQIERGGTNLIFLGDSITSGWESEGKAVWQRYYGGRKAVNFGISGDETGHLLWRMNHLQGISPKVAVVLIGANNAYRRDHSSAQIAAGIKAVVVKLRKRLPRTKILLLGIFPAGARPGRFRHKTGAVNKQIKTLADGKKVHYLEIGANFLGRKGHISQNVMFDYLHLTEKGYLIWAKAMEPTLRRLLGDRQK